MRPELSVVVMGYRDGGTIVATVASVLNQAGEVAEVVVVTSGGDDSGPAVRAAYPGLRVVESSERLLPGAARNQGVAATTGRVVAFLAADCRAAPGWVRGRVAAHAAGHRAVAGAMALPPGAGAAPRASRLLLYPSRVPSRAAGTVRYPDDGAHGLSVERAVLDAVGPYDEGVRVAEDTDMARRLDEAGVAIWFAPDVRVVHAGPATAAELVRDQYRRGGRRAAHAPPSGGRARVALLGVTDTPRYLIWVAARARRHRPPGARALLSLALAAPLVLAGAVAWQAGWTVEAVRRASGS